MVGAFSIAENRKRFIISIVSDTNPKAPPSVGAHGYDQDREGVAKMAKAVENKDGVPKTQCPICGRKYELSETDNDATACPDCEPR